MITYEASLSCDCDGCANGISSETKCTPQEAEAQVEMLATERGWVFELGKWLCPGCREAENQVKI